MQADRTRGWFGAKKEEVKDEADDASSDLGAAARQARDKVATGAEYVKDRCVISDFFSLTPFPSRLEQGLQPAQPCSAKGSCTAGARQGGQWGRVKDRCVLGQISLELGG